MREPTALFQGRETSIVSIATLRLLSETCSGIADLRAASFLPSLPAASTQHAD